jgi:hypothetical protein
MPERMRLGERPDPAASPARCASAAATGLSNAGLARMLAGAAPARRRALGALGVRSVARQTPAPARPAVTARGTNPSTALELINKRGTKKVPASVAQARKQAEAWAADVIAALEVGAAASGASHAKQIIENDKKELARVVELLIEELEDDKTNSRRFKNFQEKLTVLAGLKAQELALEFGHNVILETNEWGRFGWDWEKEFERLDEALQELPPERVWGASAPLRFRRELSDPSGRDVGGKTDPATSTITLFSGGMDPAPYGRSKAIGLPGYLQTIRHEVGHLVERDVMKTAEKELFEDILGWHKHSWHWVGVPLKTNPRTDRKDVIAESGVPDDKLDEWLKGFKMGKLERSNAVEANGRIFIRAEGTGYILHSFKKSEAPEGPEFEYALSNWGDYLSELYAFAVSKPDWLAGKLSARQFKWWRERVFSMPADDNEVAKQLGVPEPLKPAFLTGMKTKFTWQQADRVLADVHKAAPAPAAATP